MIQPAEGDGGFDFDLVLGAEATDDSHDILSAVLWPMIDEKWGGDWLKDSVPGADFRFPKTGYYDGRWFEVTLMAGCETVHVIEGEGEDAAEVFTLVRIAGLIVEEAPDPMFADSTLDLAASVGSKIAKEAIENSRDFPDEPEYQLKVREGVGFHIDTVGETVIHQYRSIQDADGEELWNSLDRPPRDEDEEDYEEPDEDDEDDMDEARMDEEHMPVIVDEDIDRIIIGAEILGVSSGILVYLQALRNNTAHTRIHDMSTPDF